jgi:SAM-dependent methyltransferase
MSSHLGGFVPGGDPNTTYPVLWEWFVEEFGLRSVLDVGCGDGAALRAFRRLGCLAEGVDGVEQPDDGEIFLCDYTTGTFNPGRSYDLVWSCEFVEHVEEEFVPNFLKTFQAGRYVAMTHAVPGQPGYHHVNCRDADYWVSKLESVGFRLDEGLTGEAREISRQDEAPHNYFTLTGMVFTQ